MMSSILSWSVLLFSEVLEEVELLELKEELELEELVFGFASISLVGTKNEPTPIAMERKIVKNIEAENFIGTFLVGISFNFSRVFSLCISTKIPFWFWSSVIVCTFWFNAKFLSNLLAISISDGLNLL